MLLVGWDREVAAWAAEQLGMAKPDFGPCVAIGVVHRDDLVAAAVYNNYRRPDIQVTFVTTSPRWASPGAVKSILRYPFRQLGCKRISAITLATNTPARAFLLRLGFRQEGYHPDALPDGDAVSYGLTRADAARWLNDRTRRVETVDPATA